MEENNLIRDLSYYRQMLKSYLNESFPELENDKGFIESRASEAAGYFESCLKSGSDAVQSTQLTNKLLFDGLYFSVFDSLKLVIINEFPQFSQEEKIREIAIKLLPEAKKIAGKYPVDDEFVSVPEYDDFYLELTELIGEWIEENEI